MMGFLYRLKRRVRHWQAKCRSFKYLQEVKVAEMELEKEREDDE